jgi:hypothetical protein
MKPSTPEISNGEEDALAEATGMGSPLEEGIGCGGNKNGFAV